MSKLLKRIVGMIKPQGASEAQIKEALFSYLSNEHNILPVDSDLNEIIQIVKHGKR